MCNKRKEELNRSSMNCGSIRRWRPDTGIDHHHHHRHNCHHHHDITTAKKIRALKCSESSLIVNSAQ